NLAFALAGATALWLALMLARQRAIARWLGIASVVLAGVVLWAFARTADGSTALAFFQLLAGAIFTGAVLDGLLLGHWYLTDRKLPRGPINRMTWALIGAVVVEAVAVIVHMASGSNAGRASSSLSPLLTYAGVSSWIA